MLATDSWVKLLWERIWYYNIQLVVDYRTLIMPRKYDECIMERLAEKEVRGQELVAMNQVRKHQQAMFVSDIAVASGNSIEAMYLSSWEDSYKSELGTRRSHFDFGTEHPLKTDWVLWKRAFDTATSGSMCLSRGLGDWAAASPRIWRVFWNEGDNIIEVLSDTEGVIKYEHEQYATFTRTHADKDGTPSGVPATVKSISLDRIKTHSTSKAQFTPEVEEAKSFMEILTSWDGK